MVLDALDQLLVDATAGDPMTGLKWARKTLRKLARRLRRRFKVGCSTVARLLRLKRYALRANRKRLSRHHDPELDRQMRYIARQRRQFLKAGWPVISVNTKKKELVGAFKNADRSWRQAPLDILTTDFLQDAVSKAVPYGIYAIARNEGYVVVGQSHETLAFAVDAIRSWWLDVDRKAYPAAMTSLLKPIAAAQTAIGIGCGRSGSKRSPMSLG